MPKKTTKNTEFKCLKCEFCEYSKDIDINSEMIKLQGIMVKCRAENRCFVGEYNAKHFYCVQYKNANDLTIEETKKIINEERLKFEVKQYRESLKFFPTKKRNVLVKEFKDKLKENLQK